MNSAAGDRLRAAFITVLGSGYAPFASGSWGSLVALLLFLPIWAGCAAAGAHRAAVEIAIGAGVLVASVLSVAWGPWALRRFGSTDPKPFVLDEFAGQWVALLALPLVLNAGVIAATCVFGGQFFLFRLFDVLKPPPAAQLERLPAGWGVLCDDLAAGAYANLVGQLLWRLTPLAAGLGISPAEIPGGLS